MKPRVSVDESGTPREGFGGVEIDALTGRASERIPPPGGHVVQLREGEELYRAVVEQATEGIVLVNVADRRVLEANAAYQDLLGYSTEEMSELTLYDLVPYPRESMDCYVEQVQERGSYVSGERRHLCKDGSTVDVEVSANTISYGGREALCIVVRDITERKRAEEDRARLAAIVESSDDAIIGKTLDGVITSWNSGAEGLYGYTSEEVVGGPISVLVPPDRTDEIPGILARLRGGERVSYETVRVARDGRLLDVSLTISPIRDGSGDIVGAATIARDITERKRAQEALSQSEERYRAVVEQSAEGLYLVNGDTRRILETNPALQSMLGYTADELLGMELHEIVAHPREDVEANVERTLRDGTRYIRDRRYLRKDGSVLDVEIAASAIDYGGKRVICAAIRDITERKRAEEETRRFNEELEDRVRRRTAQLQAANEELEAFSYSVSHDLRAPLRAITGFGRILLEDYGDELDEEGRDYLNRIQDAGERMGVLIDDLLDLSRLTRQRMRREDVDLSALARGVADDLARVEPERRARFVIAEGLSITADAGLLRVVMENLIGNAWKFTSKEAEAIIEFGVLEEGGKPVYYVRDNGIGFDAAHAERIFDPFQRLHAEEEFEGTGVGLATVARIVRRHGGSSWAEGQTGQGATFYFTL